VTEIFQASPIELYEAVHQACEETAVYKGKTTLNSVLINLYRHDCFGIYVDGMVVGSVFFIGNEGHIAVIKEFHKCWATPKFYRFMQEQVRKRGVIKVKCGNPEAMPFIQRLVTRGYVCLENS
jgi:hypothetical protein